MGRTPCCNAEGLKKGAWTSDEDQKLIAYIQKHGEGGWRTLPEKAGLQRCGKSCRLRWANYLRPDIKRGEFSAEDEQKIIDLHATLGNRWSAIARHLPKRTDNEIKNYWNTHLKKRLLDMGIDPLTHKPDETSSTLPHAAPSETLPLPPPPSSAKLLNKLAAKLAPISLRSNGDKDFLANCSSSSPCSRSASARLLNKMASRLQGINTLKTILSKSADTSNNESSDYLERSASAASLTEIVSYSPLNHFDNLNLLQDWQTLNDSVVSTSEDKFSAELQNLLVTYSDEVNNDLVTTYDNDMGFVQSFDEQNFNDSRYGGDESFNYWNDDLGFDNSDISDGHFF